MNELQRVEGSVPRVDQRLADYFAGVYRFHVLSPLHRDGDLLNQPDIAIHQIPDYRAHGMSREDVVTDDDLLALEPIFRD